VRQMTHCDVATQAEGRVSVTKYNLREQEILMSF